MSRPSPQDLFPVPQPELPVLDNPIEEPVQLAYISPLDWLDYVGLAIDGAERLHIELTMEEGPEKERARLMNNIFTAIDVVMAATPGGGGGGPALRLAMETSQEAASAAWVVIPESIKADLIEHIARGMNWSIIKTQQTLNIVFSSENGVEQGNSPQDDGSTRANAADRLGQNIEQANQELIGNGQSPKPGWEPKEGYAPHHIVPYERSAYAGDRRGSFVQRARAVLDKFGIGVNQAENGVFLPHDPSVRVDSRTGGPSYHRRVHRADIYEELAEKLEQAATREDVYKVLDEFCDRFVRNLDRLSELSPEERHSKPQHARRTKAEMTASSALVGVTNDLSSFPARVLKASIDASNVIGSDLIGTTLADGRQVAIVLDRVAGTATGELFESGQIILELDGSGRDLNFNIQDPEVAQEVLEMFEGGLEAAARDTTIGEDARMGQELA